MGALETTLRSDRPWTLDTISDGKRTIRVKRCCEACGRPVGDVTETETDAAVAGAPLPPVADECGCAAVVEQLALFTQRHDSIRHGRVDAKGVGHPTWEELGPDAREEYLHDARNSVRVMVHLGWAPLDRVLTQIGATG